MATLKEIKNKFFSSSKKEQEAIIKELYSFSKDVKDFMNVRLLQEGEEKFVQEVLSAANAMSTAGRPKSIKVTKVNAIFSKAKKSRASKETLRDMHWYAFNGYVTFLNTFGGGPDSYENRAYEHLKHYLTLVVEIGGSKEALEEVFSDVEEYLTRHNNIYNYHLWEVYKEIVSKYHHFTLLHN